MKMELLFLNAASALMKEITSPFAAINKSLESIAKRFNIKIIVKSFF